ncbi:acetyltransferase [Defluviitalea raffinosedens]|uniref:acetyltransferase n=1 Tax=Defluviitalea raffinosedens TaxID=1450156 RepID=UPI001957A086|nr:sugar O-acyltransferase (sialic acid O-acetyltransferase NeuD family) [Defluviitalea raffinosedens]
MKKLVIVGAGGLGKEVARYIKDINQIHPTYQLIGFVDSDPEKKGIEYFGVPVLGDFDDLSSLSEPDEKLYGFCAVAKPSVKRRLALKMEEYHIEPINIIHPMAYISPEVQIGEGVLISPYCVLTTNITIGNYVHINPQCGIGHDTSIGDYSTLYWNVNVSGNVIIEEQVEIGSKAFIKQGLTIQKDSVIGAGAVVIHSVESGVTAVGVPARKISS